MFGIMKSLLFHMKVNNNLYVHYYIDLPHMLDNNKHSDSSQPLLPVVCTRRLDRSNFGYWRTHNHSPTPICAYK